MKTILAVAPTIEPISLGELLLHLRHDSNDMADAIVTVQSILPGSHAIADNFTTHAGSGADVFGKSAVVNLNAGTVGTGGTVDCKIQESDDNISFADWAGGAFARVTEENDNAVQEKAYTGSKPYIRAVARVTGAACEFSADVLKLDPLPVENDLLNGLIAAAREHVEDVTRRALLTQTLDCYLDAWPDKGHIILPYGNLQSVTTVKYKDSAGNETIMTAGTDYLVETNGDQYGRIVLPYGKSWPSFTPYPSNPVAIRFVSGWAAAGLVPAKIRTAIKMVAAQMYANRGEAVIGQSVAEDKTVDRLLAGARLWREF